MILEYIVAKRTVGNMSDHWEEFLVITRNSDSLSLYVKALEPACLVEDVAIYDDEGEYFLPDAINGSVVIGESDGCVLVDRLAIDPSTDPLESFKLSEGEAIRNWLQTNDWDLTLENQISTLLRHFGA